MLATLRQRNFLLLWCGGLISMMGDWVLFIGLSANVYQLTRSTLATGITLISQTVPGVLLGPVAGVFADWWNRRRIMLAGNLLQALALIPLLAVHARGDVWIIYLVGFVGSGIGRFVVPAESALLPTLVGETHLVPANALNTLNKDFARLIGPAVGGAAVGFSGLTGVALLDSSSFLAAAGMIARVRIPAGRPLPRNPNWRSTVSNAWTRVWRDWRDGATIVVTNGFVRGVFLVIAAAALADAVAGPLWVAFVYKVLHKGAVEYGWLSPAQGVGGIVGSFLLARLGTRLALPRLIAFSAGVIGLVELVMFNTASLPITLVLAPVGGAAVVGVYTVLYTLLQTEVEDRYRGRVFGAYDATGALLGLVGMACAGALADVVNVLVLLNVSACLYLVCGIVAWTALRPPGLRRRR
jgi:MFS family permease